MGKEMGDFPRMEAMESNDALIFADIQSGVTK